MRLQVSHSDPLKFYKHVLDMLTFVQWIWRGKPIEHTIKNLGKKHLAQAFDGPERNREGKTTYIILAGKTVGGGWALQKFALRTVCRFLGLSAICSHSYHQ